MGLFERMAVKSSARSDGQRPRGRRRRADLSAQIGSYLFLAGAAITALCLIVPHPRQIAVAGYWGMCALMVLLAAAVWLLRGADPGGRVPSLIVVASIAVVTGSVYFNGERSGGPALLNELYYVWPSLYVGYFFGARGIGAALVLIGVAYAAVLDAIGIRDSAGVTRWIITMSVACGTAFALYAIRRYINALAGRLSSLARTDALTGVLNRRGFDERMELELRRARRQASPLAVAVADIDKFKQLNDTHGHAAGDYALQAVAAAIAGDSREVDAVGRLGGEEFAVLMPSTDADGAREAAERTRERIAQMRLDHGSLTISFGVATLNDGETADVLIARADEALYAAKQGGRDRTVVFGDADADPRPRTQMHI